MHYFNQQNSPSAQTVRVPQVSNHILDQNILQTPLGFELVKLQYHTFNLSNPDLLFFYFLFVTIHGQKGQRTICKGVRNPI